MQAKNNKIYDISAELDTLYGKVGTEERAKFDDDAWNDDPEQDRAEFFRTALAQHPLSAQYEPQRSEQRHHHDLFYKNVK